MRALRRTTVISVLAAFCAAAAVITSQPAGASPYGYQEIINRQTSECLTVGDASNGPFFVGQNVRIWTCVGVNGQAWKVHGYLDSNNQPYFKYSPATADGVLCLDVAQASTNDGANILLGACTSSLSQRFREITVANSDGFTWVELRNVGSGKCADKAYWNVVQWTCWDPWWQQWRFF